MNQLKHTENTYFQYHKDDPVDWRIWSEDTLKQAQGQNKPILLSSGYAACHWCHVMGEESFQNLETADLINQNFIAIKLDREERPEIDHLFQQALSLMGEPGGWPLTMFLTPTGEPFFGGTYFPPEAKFGRPGFKDILKGILSSWTDEQETIGHNTAGLMQGLKEESISQSGELPTQATFDRAAEHLITGFDPKHGGFGSAPKFPQVTLLDYMWRYGENASDDIYTKAIQVTLDNICQGGLYDHVGGGFFRYCTDDHWHVPHFEKMLYDNALMIRFLTKAYQTTPNRLYKTRIFETIDWVLNDMSLTDGPCFASSLSADTPDGEGAFYTWTQDALNDLLGMDALEFSKTYGTSTDGNWPDKAGQNILTRHKAQPLFSEKKESHLRVSLDLLKTARGERPAPDRDDKVLTSWNAMMATALIEAGNLFEQNAWIMRGKDIIDDLSKTIAHCRIGTSVTAMALSQDYIWLIRASLSLFKATQDKVYFDQATALYTTAHQEFYDVEDGGYFMAGISAPDIVMNIKTANDTAMPSENAVMIENLNDFCTLSEDDTFTKARLRDRDALVKTFAGEVKAAPFALGGYLTATLDGYRKGYKHDD